MLVRYMLISLLLTFFIQRDYAQEYNLLISQSPEESQWVDSIMSTLSRSDKIAQMMMVRAFSNGNTANVNKVTSLLKKYKIGALCFFQGTPTQQAELTRLYQKMSDIPLIVAMDAEWGLGMRFKDSAISYPRQMTLGAIKDKELIYKMGYQIGEQLRMIGVNLNFAPVVDINNNIKNPVINFRSFGDMKERVAEYGSAYMRGLQDAGVAACAKHFPGHGDTQVDSHKDLPVLPFSRERLDTLELYPFKRLIRDGVAAVMVAHLHIPVYESRPHFPATLSPAIITGLLQKKLNFKGLVFTDAMEMKAVTKNFEAGEAEALAIMAGNDMICLPLNVETAINKILQYIDKGKISMAQINQSVKKILRLKYRLGLNINAMPQDFTRDDIFNPDYIALKTKLIEESITLAKNKDEVVPIIPVNDVLTASVAFGAKNITPFQRRLSDYARVIHFTSATHPSEAMQSKLLQQAKDIDIFIASFHDMSWYASNHFGISDAAIDLLRKIQKRTKLVVVLFGSPYATSLFDGFKNVVVAYQDNPLTQDITAQAVYGAIPFQGNLPVTASSEYRHGTGIMTSELYRLGYSIPERVGMSSDTLALIDSLVGKLIKDKAAPSCQVLVARNGKIVYNKAFGTFTYKGNNPVLSSDIYDVASITKTAATTLAIMRLVDKGKIDINKTIGTYYKAVRGSDKADLIIRDIMAHRSGLIPWIPFYKPTLTEEGKPDPHFYHKTQSRDYSIHVARDMWMLNTYVDTIIEAIKDSPLNEPGHYDYSDLGFILLGEMIKAVDGRPLNEFVNEVFYEPLGLKNTTFMPYKHYTIGNIVPAEIDTYFRYQKIQGYVHDMNSAMLGGVAGHAGLFTNAHDLAVIYQMLLNGGYYGGMRYLSQKTVDLFTHRVPGSSRRAIGFDMKQLNPYKGMNLSEMASAQTFGHLGFTGCAVWADPKENLIYIFLSNRTFPTMENWKLNKGDYRPRIQSIVYRSLISGESS